MCDAIEELAMIFAASSLVLVFVHVYKQLLGYQHRYVKKRF